MTHKWNGDYNRFSIARNILLQIVDSIYAVNNEVEFGVRSYGTQYPAQDKNCTDSRLLVNFNLQNVNQIKQALQYTNPIGWSPIAYSLEQAAQNEINNTSVYDYSIIFITDGGESCGGDICKTYLDLLQKKISVKPYIIGLDKNATLKSYYDCLGKYVPVLEVEDVAKAVKLIVDENRPILNKKRKLNLKTVFSNSPIKRTKPKAKKVVVKKIQKPVKVDSPIVKKIVKVEKRQTDVFPKLFPFETIVRTRGISKDRYTIVYPIFTEIPFTIDFKKPEPEYKRQTNVFPRLSSRDALTTTSKIARNKFATVYPTYDKIEYNINVEVAPRPKEIFPRVRPFAARHRFVYAYRMPQLIPVTPVYDKIEYKFAHTPVKRDTIFPKKKAVAKKVVKRNEESNTKVSREVIPHNETLVQVFFINKFQRKKMYRNATPRIIIKDATSKAVVKEFIRSTSRGVPDMKLVKPGTYTFEVPGDAALITPNIRIDADAINKVYIEVTDGTIEFAYIGNLKRPVKEFQAIVNPRFDAKGKTVLQECSDKLYYAPATYYIEIKTLPPTKFAMVELDFGEIRQIQIHEPGFLQINNTNRLGKVNFLHALNDAFVIFHTERINGRVIDQKIRLQPGSYKASFYKDPKMPQLGTKEVNFRVNSNKTTQLFLE